MGFRRPLRSIRRLDTGGTGARVVITEDGSTMGGGRVLLYPNTTEEPGELTAGTENGPGVGLVSPMGPGGRSSLQLDSPDLTLFPGAEAVRLDSVGPIDLYPAPGYPVRINGEAYARPRAWNLLRAAHTNNATDSFSSASGFVNLIDQTIPSAPPGDYAVDLTFVINGSVTATGNVRLLVPGVVDLLADPRADVTNQPTPQTFGTVITGWAGGNLRLVASFFIGTGTATIHRSGSIARVLYLGPRS